MSQSDIWQRLGLAATNDTRAIRRAYAARLKTTNPEDDAVGFMALRAAYDQALFWAAHAAWQDDTAVEPVTPVVVETEPAASPANPWDDRARDAAELTERINALVAALSAGDTPPARLAVLGQSIWVAAALERVETEAHAGDFIAALLADTAPRSDALIDAAIARFGWDALRRDRNCPAAIAAVLDRADRLADAASVADLRHDLHAAWRILSGASGADMRFWRLRDPGRGAMIALLLARAEEQPGLLLGCDPARVALWRERLARPQPWRWLPHLALATLVMMLIALVAQLYLNRLIFDGSAMSTGEVDAHPATLLTGFMIFGLFLVLPLLLVGLGKYGLDRLRYRLRDRHLNLWVAWGWAPALLSLLALAGLAPAGPRLQWLAAAAALLLFGWAYVASDCGAASSARGWFRWLLAAAPCLWWQAVAQRYGMNTTVPVLIAAIALFGAIAVADATLARCWLLNPMHHKRLAIGALALGLGWVALPFVWGATTIGWALGCLGLAALAQMIATASSPGQRTLHLRAAFVLPFTATFIAGVAGTDLGPDQQFAMGGGVLLGVMLLPLIMLVTGAQRDA